MRILIILAALASMMTVSCRLISGKRLRGDGNVVKQNRSISGFSGVETHGSIDLVLIPGDFKVVVESDQNIISEIVTEVINDHLVVHFKDGYNNFSYTSATVYITAPVLNVFKSQGSGNISTDGKFTANKEAEITVGGSGDIKAQLNAPAVNLEISGSGNVDLSGETRDFISQINGSGDIHAYDLKTENAKVSVNGSGDAQVNASLKLDAEIFGSGDVDYRGRPQLSTSVHGSGSVTPTN